MLLISNMALGFIIAIAMQRKWVKIVKKGISYTTLYAIIWIIVWAIHYSGFMGYDELGWRTVVFSFIPLIGSAIGELIAFKHYHRDSCQIMHTNHFGNINLLSFRNIVIVLGLISVFIGFATFFSAYQVYGKVIDNASTIKMERSYFQSEIYSGTTLGAIAIYHNISTGLIFAAGVLGAIYVILQNKMRFWPILLPLIGATLFCFGWGSRSQIFTMLLLFFTVLFILPLRENVQLIFNKKNRPFLILFTIILVGAIWGLNIIGISTRQKEIINVKGVEMPFSFVQFIDYNVGVFASFDKTIDENEVTYGRMSFQGIEWWLRRLRIIPSSWPLPEALFKWEEEYPYMGENRSANVYTWLRYLYSDFGIYGLFVVPLIISLLGTKSVLNNLFKGYSLGGLCTCCVCYMIFIRSSVIMWARDDSFYLMIITFALSAHFVNPKTTRLHGKNSQS